MPSVRASIERIYRDHLRQINRKQAGLTAGIIMAALAAIFLVNENADKERECAGVARQQMIEWQQGKSIDEMNVTFDQLRAMYRERVEECMR